MIKLPKYFKEKIINRYENIGQQWLDNLENIIDKYKNKFNLKDIKLAKNLTMNIVLFAKSDELGEVVIKIGSPSKNSISEINYINNCISNCMPKCYFSNLQDRVIILEKINPGYSLDKLENMEERVKVFVNVVNKLKVSNNFSYDTYEEHFLNKINNVYENKTKYNDIIDIIKKSEQYYYEIKNMDLEKCILHNDLNHRNILKSNDGWKVIDPHGILGEKIFEVTQFIKSELEKGSIEDIDKIVSLLYKYLKEDKKIIYKALYINVATKIIFYMKSGYSDDYILYNKKIGDKILEYIN